MDLRELARVPLRGEGSCGGGGAPRVNLLDTFLRHLAQLGSQRWAMPGGTSVSQKAVPSSVLNGFHLWVQRAMQSLLHLIS